LCIFEEEGFGMMVWYVLGGSFGLFLMVQYVAFLFFLLRKSGMKEVKPDLLYIILAGGMISLVALVSLLGNNMWWNVEWALLLGVVGSFVFLFRYIFVFVKDMAFVETDGYRGYTRWYVAIYTVLALCGAVMLLVVRGEGYISWFQTGMVVWFVLTGILEGREFFSLMKRERGKLSPINILRYRTLLFGGETGIILFVVAILQRWDNPLLASVAEAMGFVLLALSMSFYLIFEYIEISNREAESRRRLADVNRKVMEEIRTAQSLQISLLPIDRQRAIQKIIDMEISYMPMQSVGGDYYDMFILSDDLLLFMLGDASGHGVYAAMIWAMLKVEVEELIEEQRFSHLAEAFGVLNRRITRILENTYSYITLFSVLVNRKTKTLHYLSAGHIDQLFYCTQEDEVKRLKNKNPIVGTFKNARFQEDVIKYHSGDVLLLFSDGVIEGVNPAGEQVGQEHLMQIFDEVVRGTSSASDVIAGMLMHLEDFYEGAVQDDDRTFMAIRF